MAAKAKKDKAIAIGTAPFLPGIFPASGPGIQTFASVAKSMDYSKDAIKVGVLEYFEALVSDESKGATWVVAKLEGSAKAAAKAASAKLATDNRVIVDKYNVDNTNEIHEVWSALVAAQLALIDAEYDYRKLQEDVSAKVGVDWELDVTVLDGDNGPYVYVPSDSLGSAPVKSTKGGPRRKRTYDYKSGPWAKKITPKAETKDGPNPLAGHPYDWAITFKDDEFTVWLNYDGKSIVDADAVVSDAGKRLMSKMWEDITGEIREPKSFPLNLAGQMIAFSYS